MALEVSVKLIERVLICDVQDHLVLVVLNNTLVDFLLHALERQCLVDRRSHVRVSESVKEIVVGLVNVDQLDEVAILRHLQQLCSSDLLGPVHFDIVSVVE